VHAIFIHTLFIHNALGLFTWLKAKSEAQKGENAEGQALTYGRLSGSLYLPFNFLPVSETDKK